MLVCSLISGMEVMYPSGTLKRPKMQWCYLSSDVKFIKFLANRNLLNVVWPRSKLCLMTVSISMSHA